MNYLKKLIVAFCLLSTLGLALTELGKNYVVFRPDSPYVAVEGNMSLSTLPKGTKVRLIKDESMAEMILWAPVRIIK